MSADIPEGVDPETGEIHDRPTVELVDAITFPADLRLRTDPLTKDEALLLTAHITATAKSLCWLVKDAKEREAWKVLGHGSWQEYVDERFPFSRQHADNLYKQALGLEAAALAVGLSAGDVELPEWALRGLNAEDVGRMAFDVVTSLPAGSKMSRTDLARIVERGVRERIADHKAQVSASTAVDTRPAETTTTTRVTVSTSTTTKSSPSGVSPATHTDGESTGEGSPTQALSGAPSSDEPRHDAAMGSEVSATEQEQDASLHGVSGLAVGAAPDVSGVDASGENDAAAPPAADRVSGGDEAQAEHGAAIAGDAPAPLSGEGIVSPDSPASSGADPVADEPPATGSGFDPAAEPRAWARALTALTGQDAAACAALVPPAERDARLRFIGTVRDWLDEYEAALPARTLEVVK